MIYREILSGISTFFTASYLFILYPKILSLGGFDLSSAFFATVLTTFLSTSFLALYSNFPSLLIPGLSVGPYLIYSVVIKEGSTIENALGLVFWTGVIIFILSVCKVRQKILVHLPHSIRSATIAGVGLFLIIIALKQTHQSSETTAWPIFIFGLILFFTLQFYRPFSSYILTLLFCSTTAFVFKAAHIDQPFHLSFQLDNFAALDLLTPLKPMWLGELLSITLICLFDTSASLSILSKLALRIDRSGKIKRVDDIVIPDGPGSCLAALLGTGTLTFAVESSAGIQMGGRGKITAITAATCSLFTLLLYPIFSAIPLFAMMPLVTGVGYLMLKEVRHIRLNYPTELIPAAIILITIATTFSIYEGFAFGFSAHAIMKALAKRANEVHPVCWVLTSIFILHFLLFF